ncbi:MAG: NAD(P)-dependent oxidoreductase [Chloroflexota bacterium]
MVAISERFLVTGALGCIGAWAVKQLVEAQVPVWTYDLPGSQHRLNLILDDAALSKVNLLNGDITDFKAFEHAVADHNITHIIHLAALQVPFVKADPVRGAQVNVVGTANVLEVAHRYQDQLHGVAYASSIAVFGPSGQPQPSTLYGVYKHANEDMARIYWQDYGLRTVGLRPHTVYGPGRDQGMTSTPTKAMLAAAIGRAYRISFGGTSVFHHARDMADVFIRAARAKLDNAPVFDVGGNIVTMDEIVAAITAAAPDSVGHITYTPVLPSVPATPDVESMEAALGKINWTPLNEGVRSTVELFREAVQSGKVDVERVLA